MRYPLAAVVFLVSALPLFAAGPLPSPPAAKLVDSPAVPPSKAKAPLSGARIMTPEETEKFLAGMSAKDREEFLKRLEALVSKRPGLTCYFMRQTNQDLHEPKAMPELVPLAQGSVAPIKSSDVNCLPATLVRKAGDK